MLLVRYTLNSIGKLAMHGCGRVAWDLARLMHSFINHSSSRREEWTTRLCFLLLNRQYELIIGLRVNHEAVHFSEVATGIAMWLHIAAALT
jgi:hypothetical protein